MLPDRPALSAPPPPARHAVRARLALGGLLMLSAGLHLWLIDHWQPAAAAASVSAALPAPARPVELVPSPAPQVSAASTAPVQAAAPAAQAPAPTPAPRPPAAPARSSPPTEAPPQTAAARAETPPAELLTVATRPLLSPPATGPVVPPSVRLDYRMSRGALVGRGQIDWDNDGQRYRMRLEARVPVIGLILAQTSSGQIDAQGVAPERHTEQRLRRSERAVSFVRDGASPHVSFSSREGQAPLEAGMQDRLSWIAQLTARLDAPGLSPGGRIVMPVASTGGEVQHWVFTLIERDEAGRWHLRREPDGPFDTRAEVWTLPQVPHWPQRLRLSEADGDALELLLLAS
ncbi:DUF3108 domain-containing protein [Sphaerotilus natans]|uniref:DUF3108 domain-containing protein n=1 Tax=Sphaerotilus natans TaxID=34103 RepID=UPI001C378395|nr:DUF3108 domain-containing protein [Sphaerotilus natans]